MYTLAGIPYAIANCQAQWWANPNPGLDLNPDLATFAKSVDLDLDLNIFNTSDLDFKHTWLKSLLCTSMFTKC